jgi:hypothetical protein
MSRPPSMTSFALFMYPPAADASIKHGPTISASAPARPAGHLATARAACGFDSMRSLRSGLDEAPVISDGKMPGNMVLTRILNLSSSSAFKSPVYLGYLRCES